MMETEFELRLSNSGRYTLNLYMIVCREKGFSNWNLSLLQHVFSAGGRGGEGTLSESQILRKKKFNIYF